MFTPSFSFLLLFRVYYVPSILLFTPLLHFIFYLFPLTLILSHLPSTSPSSSIPHDVPPSVAVPSFSLPSLPKFYRPYSLPIHLSPHFSIFLSPHLPTTPSLYLPSCLQHLSSTRGLPSLLSSLVPLAPGDVAEGRVVELKIPAPPRPAPPRLARVAGRRANTRLWGGGQGCRKRVNTCWVLIHYYYSSSSYTASFRYSLFHSFL